MRWRTVDEVEAVRLAALAREVKPVNAVRPVTGRRSRAMTRRVPSLPTMPWHDDGR